MTGQGSDFQSATREKSSGGIVRPQGLDSACAQSVSCEVLRKNRVAGPLLRLQAGLGAVFMDALAERDDELTASHTEPAGTLGAITESDRQEDSPNLVWLQGALAGAGSSAGTRFEKAAAPGGWKGV